MPDGQRLELSTLPRIHPKCGRALLTQCATSLIVRLTLDPTPQPSGTMTRSVSVSWVGRRATATAANVERAIGWHDLPGNLADEGIIAQWHQTIPSQDVTEQAAIAVMALLIHDLEQGEIVRYLPIGSGGDYLVEIKGLKRAVQVECSGISQDSSGTDSRRRLRSKSTQVLSKSEAGFAAMTTFSHGPEAIVHSFLHHVRKVK